MTEQDFELHSTAVFKEGGAVGWRAPSNIALVKYWGKHPVQIPANPSLSFTLHACSTRTELRYRTLSEPAPTPPFRIYLDGKEEEGFAPKIRAFLEHAVRFQPFLRHLALEIHTENSFPHSSGIASSASGMAALALCLMDLERRLTPGLSEADFRRKASFLARIGSGSASRSIDGGLIWWGADTGTPGSSDLFAIPYPGPVHPVFGDFHDTILLVDEGSKAVSSSVGHGLMKDHPFAQQRFRQAGKHLQELAGILRAGDLEGFASLVESEALSLHAMMLTSRPSFILMKPATLSIIERIRDFRASSGMPVCFTLDAGANVHVLYPSGSSHAVYEFIREELLQFCNQGRHICDRVGPGAVPVPTDF